MLADRIADIQAALTEAEVDGWLFTVFQGNDPISLDLLGLSGRALVTRRCYYVIPSQGEPRKLVSGLEPAMLDHLPGGKSLYTTWQQHREQLELLVRDCRRLAAQYSPKNELPTCSGSTPAPPSCSPRSAPSWSPRPSSRSASRRSGARRSSNRTGAPTPTCTGS